MKTQVIFSLFPLYYIIIPRKYASKRPFLMKNQRKNDDNKNVFDVFSLIDTLSLAFKVCGWLEYSNMYLNILSLLQKYFCVQKETKNFECQWVFLLFLLLFPGQWEQGCSLFMATYLGPVRATRRKKNSFFDSFNYTLLQMQK